MNTLLLCIDFINDITHPAGKLAACANYVKEHQVIEEANKAIDAARKLNMLLAQVKVGFSQNYVDCPKNSPLFSKAVELGGLQLHSWGCEFHESLHVELTDHVIIKHRVSALYATQLEALLKANDIQQVIICGVSTNMTVETTARELHDRDYQVIILANACGAISTEVQQASLLSLLRIAKVMSVEEWIGQA